jgi:hypothetical protein
MAGEEIIPRMKNLVIEAYRPHQEFHRMADRLIVVNDVNGRCLTGPCIHHSGRTHVSWNVLFTMSDGIRVVVFRQNGPNLISRAQ